MFATPLAHRQLCRWAVPVFALGLDNLVNELHVRDFHSFLHLLNLRHLALHHHRHVCNLLLTELSDEILPLPQQPAHGTPQRLETNSQLPQQLAEKTPQRQTLG